jgi:uncharacterized protein YaaQ
MSLKNPGNLESLPMDNMVMAIVPREEAESVISALIEAGHTSTVVETKGGVFRQSQNTLFIVVDDQNLKAVLKIIELNCIVDMRLEPEGLNRENNDSYANAKKLGDAIVFVWKLDQIITF